MNDTRIWSAAQMRALFPHKNPNACITFKPKMLTEKKTCRAHAITRPAPENMHSFRFLCKAMENNGSRFDGYDFYCLTLQSFSAPFREQDNDCLTQT